MDGPLWGQPGLGQTKLFFGNQTTDFWDPKPTISNLVFLGFSGPFFGFRGSIHNSLIINDYFAPVFRVFKAGISSNFLRRNPSRARVF
jgi:hypothetical protein